MANFEKRDLRESDLSSMGQVDLIKNALANSILSREEQELILDRYRKDRAATLAKNKNASNSEWAQEEGVEALEEFLGEEVDGRLDQTVLNKLIDGSPIDKSKTNINLVKNEYSKKNPGLTDAETKKLADLKIKLSELNKEIEDVEEKLKSSSYRRIANIALITASVLITNATNSASNGYAHFDGTKKILESKKISLEKEKSQVLKEISILEKTN